MPNVNDIMTLKDSAERLQAVKGNLLQVHQMIGSIYALVDTTESVRAKGPVTGTQYQALREALENLAKIVDEVVGQASQMQAKQFGALQSQVDELEALRNGMVKSVGFAKPTSNGSNN